MTNNKRGALTDIFLWLVLSFIMLIFFAVWIYGFDLITNTITNIDTPFFSTSIGDIADDSFGKINPVQTSSLHMLAFVMIVTMALSIMVTNFVARSHPAFFIVHLFITIGAIIASVILSNAYEELLTTATIGGTLSEFTASNFIMINLPVWTTVIGIFGAIFLFAGILRDEGTGGSIV